MHMLYGIHHFRQTDDHVIQNCLSVLTVHIPDNGGNLPQTANLRMEYKPTNPFPHVYDIVIGKNMKIFVNKESLIIENS